MARGGGEGGRGGDGARGRGRVLVRGELGEVAAGALGPGGALANVLEEGPGVLLLLAVLDLLLDHLGLEEARDRRGGGGGGHGGGRPRGGVGGLDDPGGRVEEREAELLDGPGVEHEDLLEGDAVETLEEGHDDPGLEDGAVGAEQHGGEGDGGGADALVVGHGLDGVGRGHALRVDHLAAVAGDEEVVGRLEQLGEPGGHGQEAAGHGRDGLDELLRVESHPEGFDESPRFLLFFGPDDPAQVLVGFLDGERGDRLLFWFLFFVFFVFFFILFFLVFLFSS